MIEYKFKLIVGLLVLSVLVTPVLLYYNRYYVLQKLFPFHSLENKIAVDGIEIIDWTGEADIDEVYLVDTLTRAIRQLTHDDFSDKSPAASGYENRVYFLSNRLDDKNLDLPYSQSRLFYLDIHSREIRSADVEFENIVRTSASDLKDVFVFGDRMALVEDYDSTRLYLIDLKDKVLLKQWTVRNPVTIIGVGGEWVSTLENGGMETHQAGISSPCESIYDTVDKDPEYTGGMNGLMEYFTRQLLPVISDCAGEDKVSTTKMTIMPTIDVEGNVVHAELSDHHLPEECTARLKSKLLTMTGWSPGQLDGQPVCSRFAWVVRCVKWN